MVLAVDRQRKAVYPRPVLVAPIVSDGLYSRNRLSEFSQLCRSQLIAAEAVSQRNVALKR